MHECCACRLHHPQSPCNDWLSRRGLSVCISAPAGWSTFKDAILANVLAKREEIKAQAQTWLASTSPTLKSSMQSTVKQVEEVLAKLDAVEKQTEAAAPS